MAYFQKCIDALQDGGHSRMMSNACFQCGDLFRQQCLNAQAVEMIREAYRCDSIAGDTLRMADCMLQIGNIIGHDFYSTELKDSVLHYCEKAFDLAKKTGNVRMKASICVNFAAIYINSGDEELAKPYLTAIADYLAANPADRLRFHYADLKSMQLMRQGDYVAALPFCQEMLGSNSIYHRQAANEYLHLIYSDRHDFVKAKHFLSEFHNITDSVRILTASESTAQANALYNYQLRERENLTLKAESQQRLYFVFILAATALLIGGGFWVYRLCQKQKQQILNQQISRLRQFEQIQKEQNEATATKQDQMRKLLLESEAYEMLQQRIAKNKPLKDADLALLDATVNQICDGFKSTLYSAYNLSAQEYAICLLVKFDVPGKDISSLLSRTTAAITQTRKRLYAKLFGKNGSASDLDEYIRSL